MKPSRIYIKLSLTVFTYKIIHFPCFVTCEYKNNGEIIGRDSDSKLSLLPEISRDIRSPTGDENDKRSDPGDENSYEIAKRKLRTLFSREVVPNTDKRSRHGYDDSKKGGVRLERKFLVKPPQETDRTLVDTAANSLSLQGAKSPKSQKPVRLFSRTVEVNSRTESEGNVDNDDARYINEWLVHLTGGASVARQITEELGYRFIGSVRGFDDIYAVSHRFSHHSSKRETVNVTNHIKSHIKVIWAEQQVTKRRVKRSNSSSEISQSSGPSPPEEAEEDEGRGKKSKSVAAAAMKLQNRFNDELWQHQWYLFDSRTREDLPQLDLRVIPVWKSGITGYGVNVLVVDDGLEWKHEDIIHHYVADISYDLNDDDPDPSPREDSSGTNSHGTRCAGEIVMQANNTKCGVGIAYGASVGGIRALDGDVTDRIEGEALAWGIGRKVDIVSCSWGPSDDGRSVEGPGTLASQALQKGVDQGRDGKGIIYVWASGNGGSNEDNCNCDGYASSIYTVSISSASETGDAPWYGEHCASTLAAAYSSGAYTDQKIVTTDLHDSCTIDFSGTSAATPLGAGIVALALEANPSLSWRDVQHAIVLSSDWRPLSHDVDWKVNGRGLHVSDRFGFGLLNANALVRVAKNWTAIPEFTTCTLDVDVSSSNKMESGVRLQLSAEVECKQSIKSLEHVQIVTTIRHSRRGVLKISVISPAGTTTDVLTPRDRDHSTEGFTNWSFMSVQTWAEDPQGTWNISIEDTSKSNETGTVESLALVLYGTTSTPVVHSYLTSR